VAEAVRREVLWLVLAVVLVDAMFVGVYFLARLPNASDTVKLGFTALWTVVTLAIVIRSLSRIRSARLESREIR
jgi:membrane protein YdbS with pleckstrin-like domain